MSASGSMANCINPCNTLTATASGGIPPYQYNFGSGWTSSATSPCLPGAGVAITYTVCVRDALGSTVCQTVFTGWPVVNWFIQYTVTPAYCGGCNGTITVLSGWPGTMYYLSGNPTAQSSPVFSNLCAGTYTLTVSPPGSSYHCPQMTTVIIPNASGTVGVTTSVSAATCNSACNGSVTINALGTGPFEYSIDGGNTWQTSNIFSALCAGTYTAQVRNTALTCTGSAPFTVTQPAAFNPVVTATPPSCYGGCNGIITTSISPSSSYQYSLNGGVSYQSSASFGAKCAGNYTVTVRQTASGCTTNIPVTVTQPPQLTTSLSAAVNPPCSAAAGGSLSISASGGTGSLSYNWLPGNPTGDGTPTITNLTAASYSCIVTDANSCSTTFITQLTALPPPVLVASGTNITCSGGNNGTASVTVTGGTAPYTYNWTPGNPTGDGTPSVSGLSYGTWMCTVTSGSPACISTQTVLITSPTAIAAAVTAHTDVTCNGMQDGSGTITGSGGVGPYTYLWNPGGGTDTTASALGAATYSCTITDANGCTLMQTLIITQPSPLLVNGAITSITCNGLSDGTASVVASGGTGIYQYDWSPGSPAGDGTAQITGLSIGTYFCTVTDANGCTTLDSANITEPSVLDVQITNQLPPVCAGDSTGLLAAAANGGTPGYVYSWSPYGGPNATANNLAAGAYWCMVTDAHGCTDTIAATLTQPAPVNMVIESVSDADCFGSPTGDANVMAFGGAGQPFTYAWQPIGGNSGSAVGLPAGTYTCVATDSLGCSDSVIVTIGMPADLNTTVATTAELCAGCNGTAGAAVTGGNGGYQFYWQGLPDSSFISNLCNGAMELVVVDSLGCTDTVNFNITNMITLHIDSVASTGTVVAQNNGTATVFATGSGMLTYQWDAAAGNQTASTAVNLAPGNYCVAVSDSAGCTDSVCVTVSVITQVFTVDSGNLLVFPNPFTNELIVEGTGAAHVQLKDVHGRLVIDFGAQQLEGGAHLSVPADLDAGMYFLTLSFDTGSVNVKLLRE